VVEPEIEPIPEPEIVNERLADVPVPESELASLEVSDLGTLGSAGDGASQITTATLSSASASFFGVEARGSRFVYIIDTSGSMRSNRLAALKIALTDSINALVDQARFAIVQYNSQAESLNGADWWEGESDDKADALDAIARLEAGQATEPIPAFRIAFELTPPPDAIYFMTDGRFSPNTENEILGSIRRLMRQSNTRPTIHTISFVDKDAEDLLRRIARMTGGSYTHVPGLAP
jgi:Mg-chelatase subunit ChlD